MKWKWSEGITTIFKYTKLWIRLADFTHVLKNENIWTDKKIYTNVWKKNFHFAHQVNNWYRYKKEIKN